MLRNYLVIALRNLRRKTGYAAITITGLATGLACCLLILLFVRDELSFDTTHPDVDRLYRLEQDVAAGPDGDTQRWGQVEQPLATDVLPQVSGIEATTRLSRPGEPLVARGDVQLREDRFLYAEPSLFDLFDAEMLRGNAADLARPLTLVLDEPTAAAFFGDADPIGQTLDVRVSPREPRKPYEVVGVMREMPRAAHVHAAIVASLATSLTANVDRRWSRIAYTYVRLEDGADPARVVSGIDAVRERGRAGGQDMMESEMHLVPVTDLHLRSVATSEIEPQGDIRYVWLFSAIALVILVVAGINYMNLATARGARRAKEVGVRKALGAGRGQLVGQFLGESLVVTLAALALALGLVALALPGFGAWMSRPLALPLGEPWFWTLLVATVAVLSVGAGSYPAFVLSSVRTTSALKGTAGVVSRATVRRILMVGQFTATVALIACTLGVQRQLHYVQHTWLSFDPDQTLVAETCGALDSGAAFKSAAERIPGVQQVAFGSGVPGEPTGIRFFPSSDIEGQEGDEMVVFDAFWVGADFVPVLDLELAAGRAFSASRPSDVGNAVLINEAAARALGWDDPLGKTIGVGEDRREVVGVVRNFHLADMRTEIGPVLIEYDPEATSYAVLKLDTADLPTTLAALEAAWAATAPDHFFDSFFLDHHFAAMYRAERLVGQVFLAFSLLAVLVACLGLFGLAMLAAEQRTKEIGIRKVLGASVASLVGLLSRESVALVGVAFVIAVPLAYLFLREWLSDFVYRADPTVGLFLSAGLVTLAIALLTVSTQALRAARKNPTEALRYE